MSQVQKCEAVAKQGFQSTGRLFTSNGTDQEIRKLFAEVFCLECFYITRVEALHIAEWKTEEARLEAGQGRCGHGKHGREKLDREENKG